MKRNLVPETFDTRMIEVHLREKIISRDQLKSHLAGLGDDAGQCEKIVIDDDSLSGNAGYSAESVDDSSDY